MDGFILGFMSVIKFCATIALGAAIIYWLYLLIFAVPRKFADIAEMKGHGRNPWFHFCWWCGIIGWLMVIALPDCADEADEEPDSPTDPEQQ